MKFDELVLMNPWWKGPERIMEDQKIKKYENAKIKWDPRIKAYFKMNRDVIYTLRGPRQVGKTTLLKILIRELLIGKRKPESILYLTCDMIIDNRELVTTIEEYLEYAEGQIGKERKYIFIDEIPSVKGWEKALKSLVDKGRMTGISVILTGSHAIDLKYSSERLPGRRGESSGSVNKILVPMKFSEYVETVSAELKRELKDFFPAGNRVSLGVSVFTNNDGMSAAPER